MALTPGTRLGPYEVTTQIGVGGMGEVYRATDTTLGRHVAIKVLPEAFAHDVDRLARFEREAKTLAALNHPYIAAIYGFEKSGGTHALVMELVEGPTLADRIAQGAMPVDEALPIARQIAEALEAAHEQGIIHRDLKPVNIKVRPDGTVKVLDFGLAKAMEPASGSSPNVSMSPTITSPAMTQAGMIMGTAAYMSPEQASGKPVDRRADVWSFGVVLWEMLTGRRLFDAETISHTLADVLRAPIDFTHIPSATPASVRDLLRRCLDRDPKTRLRDIGEARVAIQRHLADPAAGVRHVERRPALRWPWAVVAAVALAAGAAAGWFAKPTPEPTLVKMEMALPEGVSLPPLGPVQLAFSPEGDRLAFVGAGRDGRRSLWLRNLETDSAVALAGTQNAQGPFWSPDGRSVAFFADGKLQKVDVAGGTPVVLCQTGATQGSWNREGVIVLGGRASEARSIQQVSASGGVPRPVFALDAARGEISHGSPYFLPDGQHFLYISYTQGTDAMLGSLDGTTRRVLFPQTNSPVFYAPDPSLGGSQARGWLLYVVRNQLFARPFDAQKRELTGEGVLIADSVLNGPSWAASSKGLLLVRHNQSARSQLTWFSRDGKAVGTVGDPGSITGPRISPDQKTIAYSRDQVVWLHDIARNVATRLVSEQSSRPIWSLDGQGIIYDTVRDGKRLAVERPVNGTSETIVFQGKGATGGGVLSLARDGRWIAMFDLPRIFFVSRSEGGDIRFLENVTGVGEFSPDGRWFVYAETVSGRLEVFVQAIPTEGGGSSEAAGARFQISSEGGTWPHWSRDGKEIVYLREDSRLVSVPLELGERSVRPGIPTELFETRLSGTGAMNYDVAPDGQRFLIPQPVDSDGDRLLAAIVNWPTLLRK